MGQTSRQKLRDDWEWDPVGILAILEYRLVRTPMDRLRLAVLKQALGVLAHPKKKLRSFGGRVHCTEWLVGEYEAERAWFLSDDVEYPLSFRAICIGLGIDADYLRAGMLRIGLLVPIDRPQIERERAAMQAQLTARCQERHRARTAVAA